jgi:hypothetical protein
MEGPEGEPVPLHSGRRTRRKRATAPIGHGLHLFALTGFVVARPIFDLLGNNASLFIAWRTTPTDLIVLIVGVLFVPVAVLWMLEAALVQALPRRPGRLLHPLLCGVLAGLLIVEEVKKAGPKGPVLLAIALVVAAIAAALVARIEVVRQWLRYAAVAPVLFCVMLLVATPVPSIVFAGNTSSADVVVGTPTRVVLVVFDEFPLTSLLDGTGHIDRSLYPNFAALSESAMWYRNSTTIAPLTEQAVPAILTGRNPTSERTIPYVSEYPDNLFTLLGGRYAVRGRESVTGLCPRTICRQAVAATGVEPGARGMASDIGDLFADIVSPSHEIEFSFSGLHSADPTAIATADAFVNSLKPTQKRPRLDVLHVLLPHFPWHYLGSGQDYSPSPPHPLGLDGQDWLNDWTAAQARHRHLLQVQATDTLLGRIVARLRDLDEYDDSLIIVTADHGAAFRAGEPFRGVATSTATEIVWTPLFVKYPGSSSGQIDDRPAQSVDIVPTIADVIDVDLPWETDGISLLGEPRPEGDRPVLAWERNALRPDDGNYLAIEGPKNFAAVLRSRATNYDDSDPLRLYRLDEWGPLIGQRVDAFDATPNAADADASVVIDGNARFDNIVAIAPRIPWADFHASFRNVEAGRWFAVTVNGTIAGVFPSIGDPLPGGVQTWGTLPISLFAIGANDVEVYEVQGTTDAPTFTSVTVSE